MSYIRFDKQLTPGTPPIGKVSLFVDSADNKVATIDENGTVSKFLASVSTVNGFTGNVTLITDDILEGVNNLYYTDVRVDARITLQKGIANGLATLDSAGKIPTSQLSAIAITSTFVVASEVAQLALTVQEGDIAVRTDINESFVHNGGIAGTIADWTMLLTPTNSVLSVNGFTGIITLSTTDITEGSNLYYTQGRFDSAFTAKDTDALSEGVTNLYYTQARFDIAFIAKSTTDLTEGTNLYYTQGRFDTAFTAKDTDSLSEGVTNFYYTQNRFDVSLATKTTDNITEGATNLYFTQANFDSAFNIKTTDNLTQGTTNLYSQWSNNSFGINHAGKIGISTATPNTSLDVQGGMTVKITNVNTPTYTLLNNDYILNIDTTLTSITITLPTAQMIHGRIMHIKDSNFNSSINNIIINTEGSELIENDTNILVNENGTALSLYSDGIAWFIL